MSCGLKDLFSRIFLCRRSYAVKQKKYDLQDLIYDDAFSESEEVTKDYCAKKKLPYNRSYLKPDEEYDNEQSNMNDLHKEQSNENEISNELSDEIEVTNSNEELREDIQNKRHSDCSQSGLNEGLKDVQNRKLKKPVFMTSRASKIYIARKSRQNLKKLNQQKSTTSDSKILEDEVLQNISCEGNFQKISMHEDSVQEIGSSKDFQIRKNKTEKEKKPAIRYGNLSRFAIEQEKYLLGDSCDVNDIIPTNESDSHSGVYDKRNLSILENKATKDSYDKRNMSILEKEAKKEIKQKETGNITTNMASSLKRIAKENNSKEEAVSDFIEDKLRVLLEESLETFIKDELTTSSSEAEEETEVSCSINFHDRRVFNRLLSKKLYELLIEKISRVNKSSKNE